MGERAVKTEAAAPVLYSPTQGPTVGQANRKGRPRSTVAETKLNGAAGITYYWTVMIDNTRCWAHIYLDTRKIPCRSTIFI